MWAAAVGSNAQKPQVGDSSLQIPSPFSTASVNQWNDQGKEWAGPRAASRQDGGGPWQQPHIPDPPPLPGLDPLVRAGIGPRQPIGTRQPRFFLLTSCSQITHHIQHVLSW